MIQIHTPVARSCEPVMNAQAMYRRVLSSWAMDVLALRRRGWDKPTLRLVPSARRRTRPAPRRKAA